MRSSGRPEVGARAVAFRVLARVAEDAAFASTTLDAELARAGLDERDARLAAAIVYGTLRELSAIDAVLASKLHRGGKPDAFAKAALRASIFQLGGLDRQAPHAVVDEAVRWVRGERGPKVAGFVNAVLRRILAEGPALRREGVRLDPEVDALLRASIGEARYERLRARASDAPPIDLRLVGPDADREAVIAALRAARPRAEVAPCRHSARGIRTRRIGDPRTLPGYDDGAFVVQEEGSQLIAFALGARPGERVLDACAGRGGKTTWLAEAVGPEGSVVATDLHEGRLAQIADHAARLRLRASLETRAVDFTVGTGGLAADFDRVLVDSPCSGLGTVHRRPEIAGRLDRETVRTLAETQQAILERAATLLRPGGTLLFAVCSLLDAESVDVVRAAALPGLSPSPFDADAWSGLTPEPDGGMMLGPFLDDAGGTDGYRVFRFVRV